MKDALRGSGRPKKFFSCEAKIKSAAPAVKPMITVCDMKLTSVPRRAIPIRSWNMPVRKVSVSTSLTYSGVAGAASGLMVAKTNREIALVGPEIKCHEDPNSAAIIAGAIAQ